MRNDHYPQGTVQALLLTEAVTANTRCALQNRLQKEVVVVARFFDADMYHTLRAVCMRLIPQAEPERMVDLAGCLDSRLAEGKGDGWRYDAMPTDGKAFMIGLNGISKTSVSRFGLDFHLLAAKEQDEILDLIQSGAATGPAWQIIPAALFFEELLAALVEIYYSHPFAKEDIGEVAMADAKGWQKIGLDELEVQEPQPLKNELYARY
jgi:hypothetical protein